MLPSLAILGACLCWGIDNNLTRKIALTDATWLAAVKGGVAGLVNLVIAFALGAQLPPAASVGAAMLVGLGAYGVSLVLFIVASTWHMRIGMQIVIEDYVHNEKIKLASVMANNFFCIAVALASIYAILKMSSGV